MIPPDCPNLDDLMAYLTDCQQGRGSPVVEQHLDACEICLQRLETLYSPVTPASDEIRPGPHSPSRHATTDSGEFFLNKLKSSFPRQLPSQIGPFQVLRLLAEGGTGDVYECRDTRLNRRVAIKTIRPQMLKHRVLERLNQEARIQGTLSHDNIVPLHDFGTNADGIPYLVMEMIDGGTLSDLVRDKPLSPTAAARLIATCARAVHYAHEKGVLHRDLKPSNILIANLRPGRLDKSGLTDREHLVPKITDFGLAKLFDDDSRRITQSGTVLGTPSYMSPEQAAGGITHLGPQSDVYALGVILYECLTGRPPFLSDNVAITLRMIQENEPPSPQSIQPEVSRDLNTICMKCLEKTPERRYPTALALAEELDSFLDAKPIQARPVSELERAWRWCRRKPLIAASLAITLLSLTSLTVASVWIAIVQKKLRVEAERNRYHAKEEARRVLSNYKELDSQKIGTQQILFDAIQNTISQVNQLARMPKENLTPELLADKNRLNQKKWVDVAKQICSQMENDFSEPEFVLQLVCFIVENQDPSTPPKEQADWQDRLKHLAMNYPPSATMSNQTASMLYQATLRIASDSSQNRKPDANQVKFATDIYNLRKPDHLSEPPTPETLQLYAALGTWVNQSQQPESKPR